MKITHTIHEYIIEDADNRYSVKHNLNYDKIFIWEIVEDSQYPDRNTVQYFDVPEELLNKVRNLITNQ